MLGQGALTWPEEGRRDVRLGRVRPGADGAQRSETRGPVGMSSASEAESRADHSQSVSMSLTLRFRDAPSTMENRSAILSSTYTCTALAVSHARNVVVCMCWRHCRVPPLPVRAVLESVS